MRRVRIIAKMDKANLHINRNGDVTLSILVENSVAKWLESAIVNVTPSDFENWDGDECGMNADGFAIAVYPEMENEE